MQNCWTWRARSSPPARREVDAARLVNPQQSSGRRKVVAAAPQHYNPITEAPGVRWSSWPSKPLILSFAARMVGSTPTRFRHNFIYQQVARSISYRLSVSYRLTNSFHDITLRLLNCVRVDPQRGGNVRMAHLALQDTDWRTRLNHCSCKAVPECVQTSILSGNA